jgi:hypothetical protein
MIIFQNAYDLKVADTPVNTHGYITEVKINKHTEAMVVMIQCGTWDGTKFTPDTYSDRSYRVRRVILENRTFENDPDIDDKTDFTNIMNFIDPYVGFDTALLETKLIDLGFVKGTQVK